MASSTLNILVTGANGFIGKNLVAHLNEETNVRVIKYLRENDRNKLKEYVSAADIVVHLAGENRPKRQEDFVDTNEKLTRDVCQFIQENYYSSGKSTPIIFASSKQATSNNPYGVSKLHAEQEIMKLRDEINNPCTIYRLPGVFGKWCKPNYNSVVATFCYNIAHGIPINIHDAHKELELVYIDDVVNCVIDKIFALEFENLWSIVEPTYKISLGSLANELRLLHQNHFTLNVSNVGTGLRRALYATYISYLPNQSFCYPIDVHRDARGNFVEFIKTQNNGQISYFSAFPGVTRGQHYHHTKSEKFLVVKGKALFKFRDLNTGEAVEIQADGDNPKIVTTIPGWAHDVTNIGSDEMLVLVWANEVFDPERPDTFRYKV